MIISRADFPLIKWGIFIFLFVLCLEVMAVASGRKFIARSGLDNMNARKKMSEARSHLDQATQDKQDRNTYAAEYEELLRHSIIGNSRSLNWAIGLEKLRSRNLVIDFKYTISPQQPYSPSYLPEHGNYDLRQTRLSIRFDLLHEEQLLAFLSALHNETSGRFFVDHCSVERRHDFPMAAADSYLSTTRSNPTLQWSLPNLHAECAGGWLKMNNRTAS